jgi:uncharacterized membrane protein
MPALTAADDRTLVDAMQQMIVKIEVMLVVTFAVHFPLNYDLRDAGDPARIENLAAARDDFVTPWVAWEIVRTLASTAAFGSLTWALVLRGRRRQAQQGDTHERRAGLASAA